MPLNYLNVFIIFNIKTLREFRTLRTFNFYSSSKFLKNSLTNGFIDFVILSV